MSWGLRAARCSASRAFSATSTWWPSWRNQLPSDSRTMASSSTTSRRRGGGPAGASLGEGVGALMVLLLDPAPAVAASGG